MDWMTTSGLFFLSLALLCSSVGLFHFTLVTRPETLIIMNIILNHSGSRALISGGSQLALRRGSWVPCRFALTCILTYLYPPLPSSH
jgi:hypothetical protein